MAELNFEELKKYTHDYVEAVSRFRTDVRNMLDRLAHLRKEEKTFLASAFSKGEDKEDIKSSYDEIIAFLEKLYEDFETKELFPSVILCTAEKLLQRNNGGMIIPDEFSTYALNLTSCAKRISVDAYELSFELREIFKDAFSEEACRFTQALYSCADAAERLSECYLLSAKMIFETRDSVMLLDMGSSSTDFAAFSKSATESVMKNNLPCSAPSADVSSAAPHPASYNQSRPVRNRKTFPRVSPEILEGELNRENYKYKPKRGVRAVGSILGGFFGFFGKKRKEEVQVEDTASVLQLDEVQFSAIAEEKLVPGKYLPLNVIMYEDKYRQVVDEIATAYSNSFKEAKSGYHSVERSSAVKVVLTSPDIEIKDEAEEQKWNGKYLNFEFAVKIPDDFSASQALFNATVYINNVIATRLKLILDCDGRPLHNVVVSRFDIESAFVSYASQDRSRVAAIIQGMKKARPDMDIFFDVESLRSGQKWEEALKSEIENRDVLFLCWSKYAKESKWVDMEWRYAFDTKGEDGIEPVPIESPESCPPPEELQQKHFNDRMLFIIKDTDLT